MNNAEMIRTRDGAEVEIIQKRPLNIALAKLEGQEERLAEIKTQAMAMKVVDKDTFTKAGELIAELKKHDKDAEATTDPFDSIIKRAKEFILTRRRKVTNAAEEIRGVLTGKMAEYTSRVERERKAEEDRVQKAKQATLEREAEQKRRDDVAAAAELKKRRIAEIREDLRNKKITKAQSAKLLREAGADEEAALAQASADADDAKAKAPEIAKETTVKSEVPKVAGVVQRTNRKFRVVKPQQVKLKYLVPDLVAIGEIARNRKLTIEQVVAEVGGIEVWEEKSF